MAVPPIFSAGIVPRAVAGMEREAVDWTIKSTKVPDSDLKPHIDAHSLLEVDGNYPDILMTEREQILSVVEEYEIEEVLFADTVEQKNALWKLRRNVAEAVKQNTVYKEEDTVVPRYELPKLLIGIKEIGAKYGFKSICYGHAGDGNLHVNIVKLDMPDELWKSEVPKGVKEIFKLTKSLNGTISGEHGIGLVQKEFMSLVFSEVELNLMYQIKKIFDPKNIMNPGKIFPSTYQH